jgi:hypothetical protein
MPFHLLRTGFKSGWAFGGLESPAVCQSGAVVVLLVAGGRPTARPAATLCPLKEPSEPRGFAPPDHERDS